MAFIQRAPQILNTEILLVRSSSGDFYLSIAEANSNLKILDIRISDTEIANFISNRQIEGEAEYYPSEDIGKFMEFYVYEVCAKWDTSIEEIHKRAEEMMPGWKADYEREFNHHKYKDGRYAVSLRRWINR